MRVSEVFAMGGGGDDGYRGYTGGFERYLPYGGVDKPCGYYPDTGRWTYRYDNDYRWEPCGCGYGYSHSFGLRGMVG